MMSSLVFSVRSITDNNIVIIELGTVCKEQKKYVNLGTAVINLKKEIFYVSFLDDFFDNKEEIRKQISINIKELKRVVLS